MTTLLADSIAQLRQQLEEFRAANPPRRKLPESLWQSAVELARQQGVYAVAHPLRLDYTIEGTAGRIFRPAPKDNQTSVCRTDRAEADEVS